MKKKGFYAFMENKHLSLYALVDYRLMFSNHCIAELRIMHNVRLYGYTASLLTSLEQTKKRGRHRRKVHAGTCRNKMSKVVNQPIEQIRKVVRIWEPEQLELRSKVSERTSEENGDRTFYVGWGEVCTSSCFLCSVCVLRLYSWWKTLVY